jgi:3-phosphoshikimate 1-carboxyvinyltransferase
MTPRLADTWPAPVADRPVCGTVSVPGSKSMTNRALLCAALADGTSHVRRPLDGRDSSLMSTGLSALGAGIDRTPEGLAVTGCPPPLAAPRHTVDVGLAGTVARFLPPVAALAAGDVRFDGDPHMRQRPLRPLLDALRALGAMVDDGGRGALPVTIRGAGRVAGGSVKVDAAGSSQLVSGLLLAAPYFDSGAEVQTTGPLPSAPHVAMTVQMMRRAGATVDDTEPGHWRVEAGVYHPADVDIEPEVAGASYFLAAAAITGGSVTVAGWPRDGVQPAERWLDVFRAMGATTSYGDDGLTLHGPDRLEPVDVDLRDISEIVPTVAVLAAVASGPSRLRGIEHMRGHETDRLAALAAELTRVGVGASETADGLLITPHPLRAVDVWQTYADHRMAMSAAVLGLVVPGLQIADIACTAKTIPDFANRWTRLVSAA